MTLSVDSLIEASDLNNFQDGQRATLNGVLSGGYKGWGFYKRVYAPGSATPLASRYMEIIPSDDWELVMFGINMKDVAAGETITATITTPDDTDNTFLLGEPISASITSSGSAFIQISRAAYTSTTGKRVWLLRGVKYRFTVSSTDASPPTSSWAEATVACKSRLRDR